MQLKLTQVWAVASDGPCSDVSTADIAAVCSQGIAFDVGRQQPTAQLTACPVQPKDASPTSTAADPAQIQLPESFADLFPENSIIPGTSYAVCYSIGSSCPTSAVLVCKDMATEGHDLVALKVALVDTPTASSAPPCSSQLAREAQLLQQLKRKAGIPALRKFVPSKILSMGSNINNNSAISMLEMQLLGPSVAAVALRKCYQYSSQLWKRDAVGMLEALQSLHSSGQVMGVVHPNSFCQVLAYPGKTGVTEYHYGSKASHVYISKPAASSKAGKVAASLNLDASNICFASDATLLGRPLTPLDDWESLGYTLLWMATGSLPWSGHFSSLAAAGPLTSELLQQLAGLRNELLQDLMDRDGLPDFAGMWFTHIVATTSPKGNLKFMKQLITYAAAPAQEPAASEPEVDQTIASSSMSLMSCSNPKRNFSQGAQQASTNAKKQHTHAAAQLHGSNKASITTAAHVAGSKRQRLEEAEAEVVEE